MKVSPYLSLIDRSLGRRTGICYLLGQDGLHVEPFQDVSEFLDFRPAPGLVLINDEDSLLKTFVGELAREHCWYPYVVYSEEPQWRRAVDALHNGARDYVGFPEQLKDVHGLQSLVNKEIEERSGSAERKAKAKAQIGELTRREIEVLDGVIAGHTSRLIGEMLGISVRTVETHRYNIMQKLDAKNGAGLVRIASDAEFIPLGYGLNSSMVVSDNIGDKARIAFQECGHNSLIIPPIYRAKTSEVASI